MIVSSIIQEGICRLVFSGELTSRTRAETDAKLIEVLRRYRDFEVDLSGVDKIDETGVRLMLWFKSIGRGKMRFTKVSPAVQQALDNPPPPLLDEGALAGTAAGASARQF